MVSLSLLYTLYVERINDLIQIFLDEAQKIKSAKAAHMDVKLSEIDTYFYEEL